jgi:DNA-damage-inducible protein D
MENELSIFEQKHIRRVEFEGIVYFSLVDIIEILTESTAPSKYWDAVKRREPQLSTICRKLKIRSLDGKKRASDCADTEGVLRIIMSIPSPKAEPLKLWLASIGTQSIIETENPELGIERMAALYKAKGYTDEWVMQRLKTIEIRKELTEEWQQRGVKEAKDYSILTATIAKGTFGLTPTEHKDLKGLDRQNLRDHMTTLELIFTALSEETTRQLAVRDDAQGFDENYNVAQKGGDATGGARKNYEQRTGLKVVSDDNFLSLNRGEEVAELPKD